MQYLLSLGFDLNNLGAPLEVSVTGEVGGPPIAMANGAYMLQKGDSLDVAVRYAVKAGDSARAKVSSLAMAATLTGERPGKHLSPFNKFDASTLVREWGLPASLSVRDVQSVVTTRALRALTVSARRGGWSVAGYLSLLIEREDEDGGGKLHPHMFPFSIALTVGD